MASSARPRPNEDVNSAYWRINKVAEDNGLIDNFMQGKRIIQECTFYVDTTSKPAPNINAYEHMMTELATKEFFDRQRDPDWAGNPPPMELSGSDFDIAKWRKHLVEVEGFDPNEHVLQVIGSLSTPELNLLKTYRNPDDLELRQGFMDQVTNNPEFNFHFRIVDKKDEWRPISYREPAPPAPQPGTSINPSAPSSSSAYTNPFAPNHGNDVKGKGKRTRSPSPSSSNNGNKRSNVASKRPRLQKYKPDEDGGVMDSDVESDDPYGDGPSASEDENSDDDNIEDPDEYRKFKAMRQVDKLINSKNCEQFENNVWKDCCAFFRMDPDNQSRDQKATVKLGKKTVDFYVYQAYAVYVMMLKSRGLAGGGFLADEQGLGKTREGLGFCIVEHILASAWDEVAKDRDEGDGQHNSSTAAKIADSCPSEADGRQPFSIPCPCWDGSVSSKLPPKQGPSLIIVPPTLLNVWGAEFYKMTGFEVDRVSRKPKQGEFDMELAILHSSFNLSAANRSRVKAWLATPVSNSQAKIGLTKYIVVTTSGSFAGRAENMWDKGYKRICWGRVLKDEFHKEKSKGTIAVTQIEELKGNPHTWLLSGTPFERSPSDLEAYINVLRNWKTNGTNFNRTRWGVNSGFFHAAEAAFSVITKQFDSEVNGKAKKNGLLHQAMIQNFASVLKALMIRRTTDSKWFDEMMVLLPPNTHHSKALDPDPSFDSQWDDKLRAQASAAMNQGSSKGKKKNATGGKFNSAARMLRITASFPNLGFFLFNRPALKNWTMLANEIRDEDWYTDAAGSPYARYLTRITTNSPKIAKLNKVLTTVSNGRDYMGRPEKIIILSSFPAVIFIIYLWLKDIKGNSNVILIHAGTKDIPAYMDGYQEYEHSNHTEKSQYAEGKNATILLSTMALVGTGFTLTRAFRVLIMEPAYMRRDEEQGYSRVKRVNQQNKRTHTYLLRVKGNLTEEKISNRQKRRGGISSATFKLQTESDDFDSGLYDPANDNTDENGRTQSQRDVQGEFGKKWYYDPDDEV